MFFHWVAAVCLWASLSGILLNVGCRAPATPQLFLQKTFTAASFAEAANHFVNLGEGAAVRQLRGLALDQRKDLTEHDGWSVNERIGWMCRVLFEEKTNTFIRPPGFGELSLPWNTMPLTSWPLYPVALSGSTYFVLSEGYSLNGIAEDPKDYIQYCRTNGVFRKTILVVPTREIAMKDVAALRQSKAWTSIKWNDSGENGNWSYHMSEDWAWAFIQQQAESIR